MATFRSALSNLALLQVDGARHNYDIDELPRQLAAPHLPALLVLPLELQKDRIFRERKESFQSITFSGNARTASYALTHLLLLAPAQDGLGLLAHLRRLVNLIDDYMTALSADLTLGGALLTPARVSVEAGVFSWGDREYVGCAFRHSWLLEV